MKYHAIFQVYMLAVFFFITEGCAPSSPHEFRQEGESLCRSLVKELQQVETREDLVKLSPYLRKCFSQFAELMMAAHAYEREHAGEAVSEESEDYLASEALMEEMKRIYRIEGARKIIEDAQREALFALDGYMRKANKAYTNPQK